MSEKQSAAQQLFGVNNMLFQPSEVDVVDESFEGFPFKR